MDVFDRADLPFRHSLPEFQRLFPVPTAWAYEGGVTAGNSFGVSPWDSPRGGLTMVPALIHLPGESPLGRRALPARTAARRESRSTLKTAMASCAAASAARTPG